MTTTGPQRNSATLDYNYLSALYLYYTSNLLCLYIVMIIMKRSQRQWDQLVRAEKVPLLRGCQLYPKPGHPYRFQVYLPPLLCKPCMPHSHRLRAHTLTYFHSISNKVKTPRPSTQLQLYKIKLMIVEYNLEMIKYRRKKRIEN